MILVVDTAQFFILPPVRWALEAKFLDAFSVNFKSPEALQFLEIDTTNIQALHKKFVWKFGVIMFLLIYKTYPVSFQDANGSTTKIDPNSIKKFWELLQYKLPSIYWNPMYDKINTVLKKALTYNYQQRIAFPDLYSEFAGVFSYYRPKEQLLAQHMSTLSHSNSTLVNPNMNYGGDTRQVAFGNHRSPTP